MFPGRFVDVRTGQLVNARGSLSEGAEARLGPQGRLVIPATLRHALDLRPGERLIARVEEGRLVLEKPEQILARLKARFASVPRAVSMVDELVAERRAEAQREEPV
ncbi:MAG: AbrB/MazE/SpoVT family DNA-binding domain-containing protein [Chloroflexi bacterium]|nr:AbrB/MazE/SpoVT family DNA-binding domain-containing protein [Chloroflexota bacterium]